MKSRRPDSVPARTSINPNPPAAPGGFNTSAGHRPSSPLAFLPIEFIGTFPDPLVRLDPELPEIAVVGRSNVGKSSLINAVLGRPGIARVSATPGKTRALNVFRLPDFYLVDLPGYGYAKADKTTRAAILSILGRVIEGRTTVAGIVWLLDIRRDPSAEDERIMEQLVSREHPVLAVLTKADKLTRSAQATRARELGRLLGMGADQVALTSSATGLGIADLGESIQQLVKHSAERKG